jgi:hypothetical protein
VFRDLEPESCPLYAVLTELVPIFAGSVISHRHCVTYIQVYDTKRRSWVHKSHLSYPIQFTNVKSGAEWRRLARYDRFVDET